MKNKFTWNMNQKFYKLNYSKFYKKEVGNSVELFTTLNDIELWQEIGLELMARNIYIIPRKVFKNLFGLK